MFCIKDFDYGFQKDMQFDIDHDERKFVLTYEQSFSGITNCKHATTMIQYGSAAAANLRPQDRRDVTVVARSG